MPSRAAWVLLAVTSLGTVSLAQAEADGGSAPAAVDAGVPAPVFSVKVGLGKGITISRDDSLSLNIRARLSARDVVTVQGQNATNEVSLRTARLVFQGKALSPSLGYTLQLALGSADFETLKDSAGVQSLLASPVFDAYLEFTALRDLQLRAGQFFVPFDRARTIREFSLQFVDRQQVVSELSLDRDIGLMAFSNDFLGWGGRLAYSLGVFGGQGKNRVVAVKNPVFLWVGRVTVRPMGPFDDDSEGDLERSTKPHLAVGLAAAYNGETWRQKSTTGTVFLLPGGFKYTHLAADAVFKYAGFSFLGEVLYRHADRLSRTGVVSKDLLGNAVTAATITENSRSAWGYTLQAGFMATSQLELVARWNQLRFLESNDKDLVNTVANQGRELTVGVNLYMNAHLFKVQADYTARFSEGGSTPYSHLARVLVDLSL